MENTIAGHGRVGSERWASGYACAISRGVRRLALAPFAFLFWACDKSNDAPQLASAPTPAASSVAPVPSVAPSGAPDPFAALGAGPILREQKDVVVDGVTEKWRLEWTKPPVPF